MTGRSGRLLPRVIDRIGANMSERQILLVPEQFTLNAELQIIKRLNLKGFITLEVLSPSRLGDKVLAKTGALTQSVVTSNGINMMVQLLLSEMDDLTYYSRAYKRKGFADKAARSIADFKRAGLTPLDVLGLAERVEQPLSGKLTDLASIMQKYIEAQSGAFFDQEDVERVIYSNMQRSGIVTDARVYVHGFDLITPHMTGLLLGIAPIAKSLEIYLTCDGETAADGSLFQPARDTIKRLARRFDEHHMQWKRMHIADELHAPPAIRHIESNLFAPRLAKYRGNDDNATIVECKSPEDEARYAAETIVGLAQGGTPLDSIVVAHMSLEGYADTIERAFVKYNIPVYIDTKSKAASHPMIRTLLAAVLFISRGFKTAHLSSYMRSGFADIEENEVFALELFATERGIDGFKWLREIKKPSKPLERHDYDSLEITRTLAIEPLIGLRDGFRATRDYAGELWKFTCENEFQSKLARLKDKLEAKNMRLESLHCDQIWRVWVSLLNEIHTVCEGVPLETFSRAFESAVASVTLRGLPPEHNRVHVCDISEAKITDAKAVIIMGMNSSGANVEGLFRDAELVTAENALRQPIGLDARTLTKLERLNLIDVIAQASERLYVTRSKTARGGEHAEASPIFIRLSHMIGEPLTPEYQGSASYGQIKHTTHAISREFARLIYTDKTFSATRLTSYAECPYKQFARYALAPIKTRQPTYTSDKTGLIMHDAFHHTLAALVELGFPEVAERDAASITQHELTRSIVSQGGDDAPDSSIDKVARERMRLTLARSISNAIRQAQKGKFRPAFLEESFRDKPIVLRFDDESEALLEGRIDRIDTWRDDDCDYYVVIDNKSGAKGRPDYKIDWSKIYYGLDTQLLLYVAAARGILKDSVPCGGLVFKLANPLVKDDGLSGDEIEAKHAKNGRMRGILTRDANIYDALSGGDKNVVMEMRDSSASGAGNDDYVERHELDALVSYAAKSARDAAHDILLGRIDAKPRTLGGWNSCAYCDYRSLCRRDTRLPKEKLDKVGKGELIAVAMGTMGR